MTAIWGNRFFPQFNDVGQFDLIAKEWLRACYGLEDKQIDNAINIAADTLEFPPTITAFKKIALDFPKPSAAYERALAGKNFSPMLTTWDWANLSMADQKQKFYAKYEEFCNMNLAMVSWEMSEDNPDNRRNEL